MHATTYEKAKQDIPTEEYRKLTEALPFRKKMASDPLQFENILPVYSVKPLYIGLCWLSYRWGFSLVTSTVMPSIISYLIIGLFLFFWLKRYLKPPTAFLSGLLIMCSMFVVAIAGHPLRIVFQRSFFLFRFILSLRSEISH